MKKIIEVAMIVVLSCAFISAQNTSSTSQGTMGTMGQDQGSQNPQMQNMGQMRAMHEEMMKNMRADVDSMKATLQQMQNQLGTVSDTSVHQQLQWNVDLWQKLLNNLDKHLAMMNQMMNSHPGMMMRQKGMTKGGPNQSGPQPSK